MPFTVANATKDGCGHDASNFAGREQEADLPVDYFQSDEIMLLVVAAVVEEKAVIHLGGKTEKEKNSRKFITWVIKILTFFTEKKN